MVLKALPLWKCRAPVAAAQITVINAHPDGGASLQFDIGNFRVAVDANYMTTYHPTIGGYYVEYSDGVKTKSYSPAATFEEMYVPLYSQPIKTRNPKKRKRQAKLKHKS